MDVALQPSVKAIPTERKATARYHSTSNYQIALGGTTSVYRGSQVSRRSTRGPNEYLKEQLSSHRYYRLYVVIFVMILSPKCELTIQIVVIQY